MRSSSGFNGLCLLRGAARGTRQAEKGQEGGDGVGWSMATLERYVVLKRCRAAWGTKKVGDGVHV
jgi:hypothetical protein